jgi:hypothetical protein
MTYCTIDHRAVQHARERLRTWTIGLAIGGTLAVLGLIASFGHPPEPNECKPGPGPVIAQPASPTTLGPCFGADPRQSPR